MQHRNTQLSQPKQSLTSHCHILTLTRTCTHAHTHLHSHTRTHTHTHTLTHTHTRTHTHTLTHTHTRTRTHTHTHTLTHTHTHSHPHTYTHSHCHSHSHTHTYTVLSSSLWALYGLSTAAVFCYLSYLLFSGAYIVPPVCVYIHCSPLCFVLCVCSVCHVNYLFAAAVCRCLPLCDTAFIHTYTHMLTHTHIHAHIYTHTPGKDSTAQVHTHSPQPSTADSGTTVAAHIS
jgi:hypothetical protein